MTFLLLCNFPIESNLILQYETANFYKITVIGTEKA